MDIWNAVYYYPGGKNVISDEFGVKLSKTLADSSSITAGISIYLNDAVYMSQRNTYLQVDVNYNLSEKLTATFTTAYSYFVDHGKYEGGLFLDTKSDWTHRYNALQLTYALPANVSVFGQYIMGGYDRSDIEQPDKVVFGVNYSF